jgi:hypothetical protein
MRSIFVRVEPTVRLVHEGERVENTKTCISFLTFGLCMTTLSLRVRLTAFCSHFMGANAARTAEGQAAKNAAPVTTSALLNDSLRPPYQWLD